MDDLATLGVKVDSSDVNDFTKALEKMTGAAGKITSATELMETGFKKLLVILGPAALAGAFAGMVKHSIELQESYVRLSEIAGTLPSQIAALDLPARLAGTSLDTVASAVARLSRAVGEAQLGDQNKKGLLKALGVDTTAGTDPVDQFVQLSKAIMGMKDAGVQAYASQQLLQRSFSELRPLMKEVVEQGGLIKRTNDEDARAAKEFSDQVVRLKYEMDLGKMKMANDYVPWLTDTAKAFRKGYEEGGLLEGVIKAIQTAMTGSDLYKANKDMVQAFDQMEEIQKKIQELKNQEAQGIPPMAVPGRGPAQTSDYWQKQLDEMKKKYDTAKNYRDMLEQEAKGENKATSGTKGGKSQEELDAEAKVRALMLAQQTFDARIQEQKGFGERYAAAIQTSNELAKEANKQGILSDEEYIRQVSANDKAKLQAQIVYLEEQKKLYDTRTDKKKESQETADAIAAANAGIIANDAITTAKLGSLNYQKVMMYREWEQSVSDAGQGVVDSLTLAEVAENKSYEKRKAALEVFLADNRDQDLNEKAYREALEVQHQQNLLAIERKKHEGERQMITTTLQMASDFMNLFAAKSKAAALVSLAINKGLAAAQVVVNTQAAIARGYAELGAAAGTINAARMETLMAIQLGIIAASTLVEGGRVVSGGGSGGGGAPVGGGGGNFGTLSPATPVNDVSAREPVVINLNVQGNLIGNQEFVDQVLIPGLKDAIDKRDYTIISPNSRQALNLQGA